MSVRARSPARRALVLAAAALLSTACAWHARGLSPGAIAENDRLSKGGKPWLAPEIPKEFVFRLAVYGDTRDLHEIHRQIVQSVVDVKPSLILQTGDLVGNSAI